jgi:hypothetical protein
VARCSSYILGECTWGACELADWVPDGWQNAVQWLDHARAGGYWITGTPTVGALMIGRGGLYDAIYGHCAVVDQVAPSWKFLVREMNYSGWDQYDSRWATLSNVLGFILPPGVHPGQGGVSPGLNPSSPNDIERAWSDIRNLTASELPGQHDRLRAAAAAFRTLTP